MDYSLNQVESLPESFTPGGVYFDKETGGVYVAQDSSTKKQFGGTVTGISAPQPAGSFAASNPGVNAIQKVSDTSSQGSTDVVTSIVYINGAKLVAMGDGDIISYGGLYDFLQSNLIQGKLFMLSTTDQGSMGFGGRPVTVEQQRNTFVISLVSCETSYNKIIRWTVTSNNQVIRNDIILPSSITVDSSLSSTSTNPVQNKVITDELNNKQSKLPTDGDGTKFLNDKGVYAAVPGPHVVAHGMVSADGTVTFYYGEGQKVSHTTGTYRFIVTGRLVGRILLAFPMQDGFYLSQAAISGGMHTITAYKNGTRMDCDFCFIVYAMN